MSDALARMQAMRSAQGGIRSLDTNVTGGLTGAAPTYTPAAGNKTLLGG